MHIVLREQLSDHIRILESVECALFTSFTFDPVFFENNILPILFDIEKASEVRRRAQINERLAASPCVVFYDNSTMPSGGGIYRYQAKGIHLRDKFFHPKNAIVAGYYQDAPMVIVSASSANLKYQAWGSNVEAAAFIQINSKKQQAYRTLYKFCIYLRDELKVSDSDALNRMIAFLNKMPESNVRFPDYDGELYFSPLAGNRKGFPEFLNEEAANKREKLVVYSPYWGGNLSSLADKFMASQIVVRPAFMKDLKTYGLTKDQLIQLGSLECSIEKTPESKEGYRFWHAKVYLLHSSSGGKVRLGIGSCNFTEMGLSGENGNVESMVVYNITKEEAEEFDIRCKKLEIPEEMKKEAKEEDSPQRPPFFIHVILDWEKEVYRVDFKWESKSMCQSCMLSLPGNDDVDLLNLKNGSQIPITNSPKSARTFRIRYNFETENNVFDGLIYEINMRFSQRNYTPTLGFHDIFESWCHHDDYWADNVPDDGGDGDKEGDEEDQAKKQEGAESSAPQELDYYEIYQGFYGLFKKLETGKEGSGALSRYLITRPDSIYNVIKRISDANLDIISKYIILTECEILVKKVENEMGVKVDKMLKDEIKKYLPNIRVQVESLIEDKDKKRIKDKKGADAIIWFEREIERAWKT
ncbi:MAG: hypothetical protein WCI77_00955 [Candidatus Omnitrophota bacterium]